MLKRITVTIPDDLLKWIEENIKKKRFHNYQHAVEYCIYREMVRSKSGNAES